MKVVKFGGTSLSSADQIKKVCDIVTSDPERKILVVSAPGKRFSEDIKVTDMLISCAKAALDGHSAADEIQAVISRYTDIAAGLGLITGDRPSACKGAAQAAANTPDIRDRSTQAAAGIPDTREKSAQSPAGISGAHERPAQSPANGSIDAAEPGQFADDKAHAGIELIQAISNNLKSRVEADKSNPGRYTDSLKAAGEEYCARLVAAYLQSTGIEASYMDPKDAGLLLTDEFSNAQVLPQSYDKLSRLASLPGIIVFPGFFGYSLKGDIVTMPRGGSDITGSILAAAVDADLYENFTDVDNVYSVNPNLISNPKPITEVTYREMRELAYAGFSVFQEEALLPVYKKGIPVRIKNTNNPQAPGTTIVRDRLAENGPVAGIAGHSGFCFIYLSKYLMNRELGFGRKVLQILEEEQISYEHMPSGIDNISIIFKQEMLSEEKEKRVVERIRSELDVDDISTDRNLALVMMVGEGMRKTLGITARASASLAGAGINLEMINQGPSEVSMMFGVRAHEYKKAIQALYAEFFG